MKEMKDRKIELLIPRKTVWKAFVILNAMIVILLVYHVITSRNVVAADSYNVDNQIVVEKTISQQIKYQNRIMSNQIDALKNDLEQSNNKVIELERELQLTLDAINHDPIQPRFTNEEMEMIYRIVEAEATSEGREGKIAVVNVLLNRLASDKFPNDIKSVIFQKNQFSPVYDGRYYSVQITDGTKDIVNEVLETGVNNIDNALYFMARKHAEEGNVKWFDNRLTYINKIGNHEFFR